MKNTLLALALFISFNSIIAQDKYDIKVNIKNMKSKTLYLAKYFLDKQYIADTCISKKSGEFEFKGKASDLDKGMYFLALEAPNNEKTKLFDFIINENLSFTITSDSLKMMENLKFIGSKENEDFIAYGKFMNDKYMSYENYKKTVENDANKDKLLQDKGVQLGKDIKKFQTEFVKTRANTFLANIININDEPEVPEIKDKAGKTDSLGRYIYYVNHYWDQLNLADYKLLFTPNMFQPKLVKYIDNVLIQSPDTLIKYMDIIINRSKADKDMFKYLVNWAAYHAEGHKIMGMDKWFVHLVNQYHKKGLTPWYEKKTLDKIIERSEILEPLIIGNKIPDLLYMDTTSIGFLKKAGFDTARTSESMTKVYYKNAQEATKYLKSMYQIDADYTVLIFYATDCGHCQKEMPIVADEYDKIVKDKMSAKILTLYSKHEYNEWKKFIKEKNMSQLINGIEGIPINDLQKKFDVFTTPVIYIINKEKKIIAKRMDASKIHEIIKRDMDDKKK
jgi:thiol-disulfide isomerase/thioredoxin